MDVFCQGDTKLFSKSGRELKCQKKEVIYKDEGKSALFSPNREEPQSEKLSYAQGCSLDVAGGEGILPGRPQSSCKTTLWILLQLQGMCIYLLINLSSPGSTGSRSMPALLPSSCYTGEDGFH